jgi:hypothetical protein
MIIMMKSNHCVVCFDDPCGCRFGADNREEVSIDKVNDKDTSYETNRRTTEDSGFSAGEDLGEGLPGLW